MRAGIYLITSPSGSRYVGQAVNLERRMNEYKGLRCKKQTYLYNSFKKYGFEQHKIIYLFECNFDDFEREFLKNLLNDLETEFILAYKTFVDHDPKGMNLTTGGGVCVVSEQSKAKMSESMKIANKRPEVRARNSEAQKIAQNRPEVRARNSAAQKEYCNRPEVRARKSEAAKIAMNRPEVSAKKSEAQKGKNNVMKSPAVVAKQLASRKENELKVYNEKLQRLRERKDIFEPLNVARIVGIQSSIF